MAKIKTSAIVDSISGKMNGTVFSRNRAGAYMRGKGVTKFKSGSEPADSLNTLTQSTVIGIMSAVSGLWRTLDQSVRDMFNSATQEFTKTDIFGDTKEPSGFNLFVGLKTKSDIWRSKAGLASSSEIPKPEKVSIPFVEDYTLSQTADGDTEAFLVSIKNQTNAFSEKNAMVIEATRPMSAGKTKAENSDYRLIQIDTTSVVGSGDTIEVDIDEAYKNVFGATIPGKKVFVRIALADIPAGQSAQFAYKYIIVEE